MVRFTVVVVTIYYMVMSIEKKRTSSIELCVLIKANKIIIYEIIDYIH